MLPPPGGLWCPPPVFGVAGQSLLRCGFGNPVMTNGLVVAELTGVVHGLHNQG
jgi:hypothetical protein